MTNPSLLLIGVSVLSPLVATAGPGKQRVRTHSMFELGLRESQAAARRLRSNPAFSGGEFALKALPGRAEPFARIEKGRITIDGNLGKREPTYKHVFELAPDGKMVRTSSVIGSDLTYPHRGETSGRLTTLVDGTVRETIDTNRFGLHFRKILHDGVVQRVEFFGEGGGTTWKYSRSGSVQVNDFAPMTTQTPWADARARYIEYKSKILAEDLERAAKEAR